MTHRVLVADDHPVVLQGLEAVVGALEGFELVGTAQDGRELVELAATTEPDVVVVDLHMPGLSGAEATRQIVARSPGVAVLVLSMHDDAAHVDEAIVAGARGYLLKRESFASLARALHTVAEGGSVFSPGISPHVLTRLSGRAPHAFPGLSERELELLTLLARGHGTSGIASRLYLSEKTVRNHVSNIMHKLAAADRAQVIALAREAGLHRDGEPA